MQQETISQDNPSKNRIHIRKNDKIGLIFLGIAVILFSLAPINTLLNFFSIQFNLTMLFLSLISLIISLYAPYKETLDSLAENFIVKVIAILFLFLLTSLGGVFADNQIMSRTLVSPDILPKAQTLVTVYFSCLIVCIMITFISPLAVLIAYIFIMLRDIKKLTKFNINELLTKSKIQFISSCKSIFSLRIKKVNKSDISNFWSLAYPQLVKDWHVVPLGFITIISLGFSTVLLQYGPYIVDIAIIHSSFVRNDMFTEGSTGEKLTLACYNKNKETYVKLSKEGNSLFAEWTDPPYSLKFYSGICMKGSRPILP